MMAQAPMLPGVVLDPVTWLAFIAGLVLHPVLRSKIEFHGALLTHGYVERNLRCTIVLRDPAFCLKFTEGTHFLLRRPSSKEMNSMDVHRLAQKSKRLARLRAKPMVCHSKDSRQRASVN